MYVVKVDGMTVKLCRSFNEAKTVALNNSGKVYKCHYKNVKVKAAILHQSDSPYTKREMYREVYGEHNHGYHIRRKERYQEW